MPISTDVQKKPSIIDQIKGKKILFVTGKGGVGKSTVAAAIALNLAKSGEKVLLAEIGDMSFFQSFFGLPEVSSIPTPIAQNLSLALWDANSSLREYVLYYLKIESLYKLFFENRVTKTLINAAPALRELSILGKITSGIRGIGAPLPYDTIVVDGYATGHSLALLRAPRGVSEVIKIGPMGDQSRDIMHVLCRADLVSYLIVTVPEELPTIESIELADALVKEVGIKPHLICNRVLQIPISLEDLNELTPAAAGELHDFADYLRSTIKRQTENVFRLKEKFSKVPLIPFFLNSQPGFELIKKMGEALL